MKKRTNREIIEGENPKGEHAYMKFSGERLIPITKKSEVEHASENKLKKMMEFIKRGGKKYLELHTHLYDEDKPFICDALPSVTDIMKYNSNLNSKGLGIIQRSEKTGQIMGYTTIFGKKFPKKEIEKISPARYTYSRYKLTHREEGASVQESLDSLKELLSKYGERIRFNPARGYRFNENTGNYEKREDGLEKVVSLILIGFTLIFLLTKIPITGFIVQNSFSNSQVISIFAGLGFLFTLVIFIILKGMKKTK